MDQDELRKHLQSSLLPVALQPLDEQAPQLAVLGPPPDLGRINHTNYPYTESDQNSVSSAYHFFIVAHRATPSDCAAGVQKQDGVSADIGLGEASTLMRGKSSHDLLPLVALAAPVDLVPQKKMCAKCKGKMRADEQDCWVNVCCIVPL